MAAAGVAVGAAARAAAEAAPVAVSAAARPAARQHQKCKKRMPNAEFLISKCDEMTSKQKMFWRKRHCG